MKSREGGGRGSEETRVTPTRLQLCHGPTVADLDTWRITWRRHVADREGDTWRILTVADREGQAGARGCRVRVLMPRQGKAPSDYARW